MKKLWVVVLMLVAVSAFDIFYCHYCYRLGEATVVMNIKVNKRTLLAMKFCEDVGKSFTQYQEDDWRNIGQGFEYHITCEDKQ